MAFRRSATLSVGLVLLLAALLPAAGSEALRVTLPDDELIVRARFDAPRFVAVDGGVVPVIGDWPALADAPGRPRLPVVSLQVVLPPGMEPGPARALGRPRELPGEHPLAWGQPAERISRPEGRRVDRDAAVYGSDALYPPAPARLVGVGLFRGYQIATIAVTPLQVRPASGRALLWSELELRLPLRPLPAARAAAEAAPRGLPRDLAALARFTANPEAGYMAGAPEQDRDADIPYLIVTTEGLRPAFERLLTLRAAHGIAGEIRTVGSILAEEPGRDAPEKVRNAIARAYRDHGTTFVLLGGDDAADDGTPIVPARFCAPYDNMASDWYYGALDGDFDANANGTFCEAEEVDYFAEVHVGRATVDTLEEANRWIDKVVAFEDGLPEERRLDFVFLGEKLDDSTYSDVHMDRTAALVPPEYGIDKLYAKPETFTAANVIASLNRGPQLTNHLGHAGWDYTMGIGIGDVENLVNASPFFSYSQGCYAGAWDHGVSGATEAISEHFLTARHGAVADVMNDRYGWYYVGWDQGLSQDLAHQFHDAIFTEGLATLGEANDDARADNAGTAQSDGTMRYCFLETNLHGDPLTRVQTRRAALRVASVRVDDADPAYANGNAAADPGETVRLFVTLANDGTTDARGVSAQLSSSAPGIAVRDGWAAFPDVPAAGSIEAALPFTASLSAACGAEPGFRLEVRHDDGVADVLTFAILVGQRSDVVIRSNNFEAGTGGWTPGGDATQGLFVREDPNAVTDGWYGPVQPDDDCTEGSGTKSWITGNPPLNPGADAHLGDLKKGTAYVTSPSLNGSGEGRLMLRFGRYFHRTNVGMGNTGLFLARVSADDGTNWTELERLEGNVARWTMRTIDVSAKVAPTATMRIRFEATEKVRYMQGGEPLVELLIDDVTLFRRVDACSGFTATETLPPDRVGGTLTAVRAGRDVELRWVAPGVDAAHGPARFFPVYRSADAHTGFAAIGEPTATLFRDVDAAGTWNGTLYYLVTARNAAGSSGDEPAP